MMIDGLQCGHFNRESFMELKRGDIGCVTVTCGFWEGTVESLDSLGKWRDLVRENDDLVRIATSRSEIDAIIAGGRTALIMGFQNSNLLEGRIRFVELFAELGVRVLQLTYNNQNELAGSCYETEDSGLARFGREVIHEMNRVGILVDLSHVGNRSTLDAIKHSRKPVAITHANADSLFPHKRNKTDDVIRALVDNGGVIGCAAYRNITGDYFCRTVDNWVEMVARTIEIAGIDHVAIGTDRSHNHEVADYDWMRKGRWTRGVDYGAGSAARPGKVAPPDWFGSFSDLKLVAPAMQRAGFSAADIDKVTYGNWLRVYRDVFPA
ncbi:dipeptidase [Mesorhizobium koreense]|jgi:microsomal dipeptidase-like Zn-dependent dipeptidase|uniref:dipeptidase n=1 Tax=Mesorhizobium koreense TaxID=3074855 RepID=UPI00287B94AD|nr:membrane dipeptidase [Mesorhizobium sp. WR6]